MVALDDGTNLRNVLLVPNLSCNSIVRITKDLNCSVTFFNDCNVLQDCNSRIPITTASKEMASITMMEHQFKCNAVSPSDL